MFIRYTESPTPPKAPPPPRAVGPTVPASYSPLSAIPGNWTPTARNCSTPSRKNSQPWQEYATKPQTLRVREDAAVGSTVSDPKARPRTIAREICALASSTTRSFVVTIPRDELPLPRTHSARSPAPQHDKVLSMLAL